MKLTAGPRFPARLASLTTSSFRVPFISYTSIFFFIFISRLALLIHRPIRSAMLRRAAATKRRVKKLAAHLTGRQTDKAATGITLCPSAPVAHSARARDLGKMQNQLGCVTLLCVCALSSPSQRPRSGALTHTHPKLGNQNDKASFLIKAHATQLVMFENTHTHTHKTLQVCKVCAVRDVGSQRFCATLKTIKRRRQPGSSGSRYLLEGREKGTWAIGGPESSTFFLIFFLN